jgi:hypothetical protein
MAMGYGWLPLREPSTGRALEIPGDWWLGHTSTTKRIWQWLPPLECTVGGSWTAKQHQAGAGGNQTRSKFNLHDRLDNASRVGHKSSRKTIGRRQNTGSAPNVIHAVMLRASNDAAPREGLSTKRGGLMWAEVCKREELPVNVSDRDRYALYVDSGRLSGLDPVVRNGIVKLRH